MKISRALAHKLQNLIQAIISYIELKREKDAIKKLKEISQLIDRHACEDCEEKEKKSEQP
jgi:hypothetical protein